MKKFKHLILLIVFSGIYFATRFTALLSLPVFADEAIYIRWAQVIKSVETLRFIPLTDGKQPLYMWITASSLKFFHDPLAAGRAVSVFSGYFTFLGCWLILGVIKQKEKPENPLLLVTKSLSKHLTEKIVFGLIYLVSAYSLFFDRLATADTLLTTFIVWSILVAILQKKYLRFDLAIILGFLLGLSWLTKSPAPYFLLLISIYLILNSLSRSKAVLLICVSGLIMFGMYNILRLGPQFHMITIRNADYAWPFSHILSSPLDPLKPHLQALLEIYGYYLGTLLLLPLLLVFIKKIRQNSSLFLFFLWLLPTIGLLSIAKVFTSRYLLFVTPFLFMFLSQVISYLIQQKKYFVVIFVVLLSKQAWYSYQLVSDPYHIKLPKNDTGYIVEWTSGWGLSEISDILISEAKSGKNIIVGAEGNFGNPKDAIQMYTNQVSGITVLPLTPNLKTLPESLKDARRFGDSVYVVVNSSRTNLDTDSQSRVKLIQSYPKPDGTYHYLYQLI